MRDLYGCKPQGEFNTDNCKPSEGSINYKEWNATRKAAKELFGLDE